jgi:alpha-L-fucosidase 2
MPGEFADRQVTVEMVFKIGNGAGEATAHLCLGLGWRIRQAGEHLVDQGAGGVALRYAATAGGDAFGTAWQQVRRQGDDAVQGGETGLHGCILHGEMTPDQGECQAARIDLASSPRDQVEAAGTQVDPVRLLSRAGHGVAGRPVERQVELAPWFMADVVVPAGDRAAGRRASPEVDIHRPKCYADRRPCYWWLSVDGMIASMSQPDVIWHTPSIDEHGSMPLGNGEVGVNLWTEGGRDLCFYIARTDAWDGDGRLCKLGRMRIRLPEGTFAADAPFVQRLDLATATIRIRTDGLRIAAWIDANAPVMHLSIDSREPVPLDVTAELWRIDRIIEDTDELFAFMRQAVPYEAARETPDDILAPGGDVIAWCHHNRHSTWMANLGHQFLGGWARAHAAEDPLLHRTFGCLVSGEGLRPSGPLALAGTARQQWDIRITTACAQVAQPDGLLPALQQPQRSAVEARPAHEAWWSAFWQRSWIRVSGDAAAEAVTRGYTLQRYLLACAGRGNFPIKFNGSLFTVMGRDKGRVFTPDWRRWGGAYWFQNTRLAYWPMIMAGDAEMARPLFRMYREALPLARARTRMHHDLDGAVMPETMTPWGTWGASDYGYAAERADTHALRPRRADYHPFTGPDDRHALCGYLRRHFSGALELVALGLDLHATTGDDAFLRDEIMPLARDFLAFYRAYFRIRGADGRLVLAPSQALETWQAASDPLPEVAALRWVIAGLLGCPAAGLTATEQADLQAWLSELPGLPTRLQGERFLLPAVSYDLNLNCENPELYAVFPFRFFGVGKPDLAVGVATWRRRLNPMGAKGWCQDPIQAAMLGLAGEARAMVVEGATTADSGSRFPAFWGPNFDWVPDQDHGGVLMIALQRMVLQAESGRLDLLPAWPKGWDVEFRLHAPGGRVVEGCFRGGTWERLAGADGIEVERHQPQ